MSPTKIIVGLSGGVDSAVTAKLLIDQYPERVTGLFMKNWEEDDTADYCSATKDLNDVRSVCDMLSIPIDTVNLATEYWHKVFEEFLYEYKIGHTPNPDIYCNQEIKFKAFLDHAVALGAEKIATGHYARNIEKDGEFKLYKGADPNKDQSYFLYRLNQYQLSKSWFPIGDMHKTQIRKIATDANFINKDKKDSTGICFIGERPFKDFLSRFISPEKGEIRTPESKIIGEHDGVWFYTLGQRQGLGIGGLKNTPDHPWYVVAKDLQNNTLYVAQDHNSKLLFSTKLTAIKCHWISSPAKLNRQYYAKTRYRQPDQKCRITELDTEGMQLCFETPQRAVTPGQSVVIYSEDECLGGGIIASTNQPSII